jgi:N-acetylneuraminate synthase/sialic acid synthase
MNRSLTIGSHTTSDDGDCYVIAEIGHNHQGSLEKAKALFRAAKECGVDAVKLQKRDNRTLYTRSMLDRPYENENSFGPTYGAHREALEFGWDEYVELRDYAAALSLDFFATAFDIPSADFLNRLGVPAFKIASGDLKNLPLLKHVASFQRPMIVSTGGATLDDVRRAHDAVMPINPRLAFLQCTAAYPAQPEEINLRVITTLRGCFPNVCIGFSDHYNGIAMAVAAYVLGARIIEKHFTLNHTWKGTDHAFSLEPEGMRKMVRDLRRARVALGDGVKRPYPSEEGPLYKMGKGIVAARSLNTGHRLTLADIAVKSPADGLPPFELGRVLGRRIVQPLEPDQPISLSHLDGSA